MYDYLQPRCYAALAQGDVSAPVPGPEKEGGMSCGWIQIPARLPVTRDWLPSPPSGVRGHVE